MAASVLGRHIQQKAENQDWVFECLQGNPEHFPYRPDAKGKATITTPFIPTDQSEAYITPPDEPSPLFVVNIPMGRLPSRTLDYSKYSALFELIRTESFGDTDEESAETVKTKVAVVLGINQVKSIDPELNRNFKSYIQDIPLIDGVVSRTIGFFWQPEWTTTKKKAYPLNKGFQILKAISSQMAEKVRKKHEQPKGLAKSISSQIPFQRIRETIKNSRFTRDFVKTMEEDAPDSTIYFTIMDDDCISLKGSATGEGIFSRLDAVIAEHEEPSIVSLGYSLDEDELPLLRLAVEIDMAVRSTMPMPYFPEPCSAFKIRRAGTPNFLRTLSFIGAGRGLESRRLTQSGLRELIDGAVFIGDGGVVTTAPDRMKTVYNQSVLALTTAILMKKGSLQALRGRTLQTHAFPKQWADILYAGLPFSCSQVTDATAPMMHIFNVYDPISRMFDGTAVYTSKVFKRVIAKYNDSLTDAQTNLLNTARGKLFNLGMEKSTVDLIQETAKRSGAAIHQILQRETQ